MGDKEKSSSGSTPVRTITLSEPYAFPQRLADAAARIRGATDEIGSIKLRLIKQMGTVETVYLEEDD